MDPPQRIFGAASSPPIGIPPTSIAAPVDPPHPIFGAASSSPIGHRSLLPTPSIATAVAVQVDPPPHHSESLREIRFLYSEFISLRCVQDMEYMIARTPLSMRVLNPDVAKEKSRMLSKLNGYCCSLREALRQVQAGGNLVEMFNLRSKFAQEHELCTCRTELLRQMKVDALNRVLVLGLGEGASSAHSADMIWILKHHRPDEYAVAVNDDGTVSWPIIHGLVQNIRNMMGSKLTSNDTLANSRTFLLGVTGRYQFEHKVQEVLEKTRSAIQQFMTDPTSRSQVVMDIRSQLEVLTRLMNKKSLIGSYPINMPGDTTGEGVLDITVIHEKKEAAGPSSAPAAVPCTAPSAAPAAASTAAPAAASTAAPAAASTAAPAAASTASPAAASTAVPDDATPAEASDASSDDAGEEVAIMKFMEMEGEPEEQRAKRFQRYCASLDFCL
uniref:Uncharacterized protein n=1 Tax=Oryza barthii TaxID=65489 RepID=A0A0D3GKS5_9ORYZ